MTTSQKATYPTERRIDVLTSGGKCGWCYNPATLGLTWGDAGWQSCRRHWKNALAAQRDAAQRGSST